MKPRRCAIYTRKSTEEGLEQAFNSLDAQREACGAYILSQAHEGWQPVSELYDDGGWTGGNMERPALKQLLTDVEAGKVDVIVVYKVDRLTRSLADFARIVDILDKAGASFVSVTQAFNTTNSMGRLTLNVLLSFAQFEREVTSERIRDKIAASKRKGMWMGGPIPLGYRLQERKLVIEPKEAETVRMLYRRYAAGRSIVKLVDELAREGVTTKVRPLATGRIVGGGPFYRGPLALLLQNPIYMGKVRHQGQLFDGEHDALVDETLWREVQATLEANRYERKAGTNSRYPSLLTGMLTDPDGRRMTPVSTARKSVRHHYYVSRLNPGEDRKAAWRIPVGELDRAVLGVAARAIREQAADGHDIVAIDSAARHAERLPSMIISEQRKQLIALGMQVALFTDRLEVAMPERPIVSVPIKLTVRGNERRILVDGERPMREPDEAITKLIALAFAARASILSGEPDPLVDRFSDRHRARLLKVSFLAPDVVAAILEGNHPPSLTTRALLLNDTPLDWKTQREIVRL